MATPSEEILRIQGGETTISKHPEINLVVKSYSTASNEKLRQLHGAIERQHQQWVTQH